MIIAFDFDDTISADKELFANMMKLVISRGHTAMIVTSRGHIGSDIQAFMRAYGLEDIDAIATAAKAKMDVVVADIWVDDFPLMITHDFKETKWVQGDEIKNKNFV